MRTTGFRATRWAISLSLLWPLLYASAAEPLPDPLSLEQAFTLAASHPDVLLAESEIAGARAEHDVVDAQSGFRVDLLLNPRSADPYNDDPETGYVNDSQGSLSVRKRLYDFGRSASQRQVAQSRIAAREAELLSAQQRLRLQVMRAFLDVIAADLRYMYHNEYMAHKYVNFDKARERQKLGQVSSVELLELESVYQDALIQRTHSQLAQSGTRSHLANLLGRPGSLPANLSRPDFNALMRRPVPEYNLALEEAVKHSNTLQALQKELQAAEAGLNAARAGRYPVLEAELAANAYERETGNREAGSVGLQLKVPLYQGGMVRAEIARADARMQQARARLRKAELDLAQQILDLVQRVEALVIENKAARVRLEFHDLNLDRSRALYEMEARTTLGDSMARVTRAQLQATEAEFALALSWAQLDSLRGHSSAEVSKEIAQ